MEASAAGNSSRTGSSSGGSGGSGISLPASVAFALPLPPGWKVNTLWFKVAAGSAVLLLVLLLALSSSSVERDLSSEEFYNREATGQHEGEFTTGVFTDDDVLSDGKFDVVKAFRLWDSRRGCYDFVRMHKGLLNKFRNPLKWPANPSLQDPNTPQCRQLKLQHVVVYVAKEHSHWLGSTALQDFYFCPRCRITCQFTWAEAMVTSPDALLLVAPSQPITRSHLGDPIRVLLHMDAPWGTSSSSGGAAEGEAAAEAVEVAAAAAVAGSWDLLVSYNVSSEAMRWAGVAKAGIGGGERTMQQTFGSFSDTFMYGFQHDIQDLKFKDIILRWHPANCAHASSITLGKEITTAVPSHTISSCVSEATAANDIDIHDNKDTCSEARAWTRYEQRATCFMSFYKFALVIDPHPTPGYVPWELFSALRAGTVPVYFGAPDVANFMPPDSFIDGSKFANVAELTAHLLELHRDPVRYMSYFAWRNCGVYGNFQHTEALGFRNLPCRLCEKVSSIGGRLLPA